jgi:hypothetical protein
MNTYTKVKEIYQRLRSQYFKASFFEIREFKFPKIRLVNGMPIFIDVYRKALVIEQHVLDVLTDEELEIAIAHELTHLVFPLGHGHEFEHKLFKYYPISEEKYKKTIKEIWKKLEI